MEYLTDQMVSFEESSQLALGKRSDLMPELGAAERHHSVVSAKAKGVTDGELWSFTEISG